MYRQVLTSAVLATLVDRVNAWAIWGSCTTWDRDRSGCEMTSDKCNYHLSPGPKDGPLEIIVGDLPPSTTENEIYIQWWAPYVNEHFDSLPEKVDGIWKSIYPSFRSAYPKYTDEDFNGGNVRVNETGHAVLRFGAPSTYHVCRNGPIRYPHIHIRYCTGERFIVDRSQTIDFTPSGPVVRACHGKKFTIRSFRNVENPSQTTTSIMASMGIDATTTQMPSEKFLDQVAANGQMDWDALEFSPVYQCLLDKKVYDLVGDAGCVDTCPENSEVKHGQCVRKPAGSKVGFEVSWRLQVHCDEECWNSKTPRTRHILRLAAADHLDITFQEITKVVLRPEVADSRRLAYTGVTHATLLVSVDSNRIDAVNGQTLLKDFLKSPASATQMLGLDVKSLEITDSAVLDGPLKPGEEKDEFAPMYDQVERDNAASYGASPTEQLPPVVIISGGAAVLVLGALVGVGLWYKRRQMQKAAAMNAASIFQGKPVDDIDAQKMDGEAVGKVVE